MATPEKAQIKSPIPHLWQIAAAGEVDQLEDILNRGADVNASNPSGLTPLMVAAYHGRIEMVRALIKHGAEVNATDDEGLTAAMLADDVGHDEIVKVLVGHAVKRKKTAPPPEPSPLQSDADEAFEAAADHGTRTSQTSPLQSAADETFDAVAEFEPSAPRAPGVRTLQEPPDIWDMVHETRSEFNAGSAFFGHVSRRHSVIGAASLVIIGSLGALGFMALRHSTGAGGAAAPTTQQKPIANPDLRAAGSNPNKPSGNQRSPNKTSRTATAVRSVFDLKTIVAGAVGLREATVFTPRAESQTNSLARPSVALFHADDKKKPQKTNPHVGNSPNVATIDDRDRSQMPASKPENDKRANPPVVRKEPAKLPTAESIPPPKPNPTPKGKVIQWP